MPSLRRLQIAAQVELVTLVLLLANLATVHLRAVSSLVGPTHGCAYLFVVIATLRVHGATRVTQIIAAIPGVGGLLALRRLGSLHISHEVGNSPRKRAGRASGTRDRGGAAG
jgi:hypothetical protein